MTQTPTIILCRNSVADSIEATKPGMVITDFDLVPTYYPQTKVQAITKPRVYVCAMQWGEDKLTRSNARQMELPVQVGVHQKVTPTDTDTIDLLICFVEQLNCVCSKTMGNRFTWLRTEPMQDPNNTPLSFLELHEHHLFQAVFTTYYITALC